MALIAILLARTTVMIAHRIFNAVRKAVLLSVDIIVEHAKDVETDVIVRYTIVGKWKFMTVKVSQCRGKKEKL